MVLAVGLASGLLVVVGGLVAFSVWLENRFPAEDNSGQALLPAARRLVTRPVVRVLEQQVSREVERRVRRKAEAIYMNNGLTLAETITRFLDDRVDLVDRRIYAYRLAREGSPGAVAALLKVLGSAPPEHKAFMAQLIGSTGNPAVKPWLKPLLEDPDERVARGALRGLSAVGGEDVERLLAGLLADEQRPEPVRVEGALGLATLGTPAAQAALVDALGRKLPGDLAEQVLRGLGQFEFSTVGRVFENYLAAPDTPRSRRVTAVEALSASSGAAVPFLLGMAGNDRDAEVRASAAWAIGTQDSVHDLGPALMDLARREPQPDVRRRLYEALLPQSAIPAEQLLPMVQAESDVAARVAGLNALGRAARQHPGSEAATAFDQELVPELVRIATLPNSLNLQMRAVFALRRANTSVAREALAVIARDARPQVATAALNGLRPPNG